MPKHKQRGEVMTEMIERRVADLEKEIIEVRQIFRSGAGEIVKLPDDATPEEVLRVLKRFADRLLSVGKGRGKHK